MVMKLIGQSNGCFPLKVSTISCDMKPSLVIIPHGFMEFVLFVNSQNGEKVFQFYYTERFCDANTNMLVVIMHAHHQTTEF